MGLFPQIIAIHVIFFVSAHIIIVKLYMEFTYKLSNSRSIFIAEPTIIMKTLILITNTISKTPTFAQNPSTLLLILKTNLNFFESPDIVT